MQALLFLISFSLYANNILIDVNKLSDPSLVHFRAHSNALALNTNYSEVIKTRSQIESIIKKELTFFKGWAATGEAHVTVITPPEFDILKKHISIKDINKIARINRIQQSDLQVLAIGSGKKGSIETYFFIVNSEKLREIRYKIFELYNTKSKGKMDFDPYWYFPHITIGFAKRDLHESDGVIKTLKKSYDSRFKLK